jgi:hypothetical protein
MAPHGYAVISAESFESPRSSGSLPPFRRLLPGGDQLLHGLRAREVPWSDPADEVCASVEVLQRRGAHERESQSEPSAHCGTPGSPPEGSPNDIEPRLVIASLLRLVDGLQGRKPNTPTLFVVPTYTFPFTIIGVMYLFPAPN